MLGTEPRRAVIVLLLPAGIVFAQSMAPSPERVWQSPLSQAIKDDARRFRPPFSSIDPSKTYSLAELIDLAELRNPETRVAWERARAQLAAWGIARSEWYPTLAAVVLAQT